MVGLREENYAAGKVDNPYNLKDQPVYIYSSFWDFVVTPSHQTCQKQFYEEFTDPSKIYFDMNYYGDHMSAFWDAQ
jgi:hypothetical protein